MSEAARLAALHEYGLRDAPVDEELTSIVRAAAMVAGVPTATLNLIDDKLQCQLTTVGFTPHDAPREDSMCAVVFRDGRSTVVPDASRDPRFANNPWVTGRLGHIRFYASVPLVNADGHALGTLCVFDTTSGALNDIQMQALEGLAGVVVSLFERHRDVRRQAVLATEAQEQQQRAEAYLQLAQERQELIDAVHDSMQVAIVACDAQGRLSLFNRAARDLHGFDADPRVDPADLARRYDLYAADGTTPLATEDIPLLRALHDGKVDGAQIVIAPTGRPPVRVLCSGRVMSHPGGCRLGAVVTMTDITADQQQRQEIADRERLLSAVVETAPDAFVIADSQGRVTAWNPAAEAMFDIPSAEAVGRFLEDLIIPARLGVAHARGLSRRATTGEVRLTDVVQVPAVRRDGSELLAELSLGSFTWRGAPHFHAFLRDVTDREAARLSLAKANADLAAANSELDRFTAMIAHDLKGPLTAIAGYTEILEDLSQQRTPREERALAAIIRATTRMTAMLNDLLAYAHAANEPLDREETSIDAIVTELATDMHAAAAQPLRITHDALPVVHAQPTMLRQVLANLLNNAVKYVAPATEPHVHVAAETENDTVIISVIDNGIGIPAEARDRVFAMFHREHAQDYQGSGIGLATCRRIVERHGGRIWIDDSTPAGTTVKLSLPR
ncbi:GAF domain-containing sensor histidine kinase [Catenuloplanes indicus]|uniref:Sensor-like histidine kinase SenX3 n=1 Tax=Catenuloplanes indicus TaxID=137267 RepID=A0AAE3VWM0_9ACTN|nr:ATP-binding protein [Catenuloplanes indicus]MDQ0365094.1 PAS domain S-box-containing protein [Catenuloplanes indicus]